jgi:hypothetical protein
MNIKVPQKFINLDVINIFIVYFFQIFLGILYVHFIYTCT